MTKPRLTSPKQLAQQLAKQWQRADIREARLLGAKISEDKENKENKENRDNRDNGANVYPLRLPIPAPSPKLFSAHLTAVKSHLTAWKQVTIGEVDWQIKSYRDLQTPLDIPRAWQLNNNAEWIAAADNAEVTREYHCYLSLFEHVSPLFHRLLLRYKKMVMEREKETIIQACQLAEQLSPNIAGGAPLRALSLAGIDSKFFEKHRQLIIKLLDCRFDGEVSQQGLETFLGACKDEHWLLVVDVDGDLLPFQQQKIRSSELQQRGLPDGLAPCRLLVCENIQVAHALPHLPNTVAVLGSGLNLMWLQAKWTANREIIYWGDMDTWGLAMLARARSYRPLIQSVLMDSGLFQRYAERNKAVVETTRADSYIADIWHCLSEDEQQLYQQLKHSELGRVEQEFIAVSEVVKAINQHFSTSK